jgi:plasmid maintenance system antidote protein VapI
MPTLQDIKKERKLTNAAIGKSLGCCASTAGTIMQGRHIRTMNDKDIERLASVLGITFERCWLAMQESYNVWDGLPLDTEHERAQVLRYRVASEMGLEYTAPVPHNSTIDGVLVVESARQIEQGE